MIPQEKPGLAATQAPREITLYPGRKVWLILLGSAACMIMGVGMVAMDHWLVGWVMVIFFGLCTIAMGIMTLFPKASYLRLTEEGFQIQTLFRNQFIRWQDVSVFGVMSIGGNTMVGFNYAATYTGQKLGRQLSYDVAGCEGCLPDTYGMGAAELADLMNAWKRQSEVRTDGQESRRE